MPFRITIEKEFQGEFWTNVYHTGAATLADAITAGNEIVALERVIHLSNILFTKMRVDDGVPNTDNYQTATLNVFGTAPANTGETVMLPLFNVVRVDFTVAGGRPSRKYLRGCMTEQHAGARNIEASYVEFVRANYAAPLESTVNYVDEDGNLIVGASVHPRVGMRQLRRGSKKKNTPSSPIPV